MNRRQPSRDTKQQARPSGHRPLPPMATPRKPQQQKRPGFLSVLFVIGILGGLAWLLILIMGWGPYGPGEVDPTPSQTLISVIVLRGTPTNTPTSTLTATATPIDAPTPTSTHTPSPTPELMPYILIGEQENLSSSLLRPGLGCEWLIVAGQVWNLQDAPVKGLQLQLKGVLGGFVVDQTERSGSAPNYGESGYEFVLENMRVASTNSLSIQLLDANGNPLSHPYNIQTFADCQKNLILINFKQVR